MKLLLPLVVLVGCVHDPHDTFDVYESEVATTNKLTANKLTANKLTANKLSASSMQASSLATSELIATADGREVLSYIVSCALPADQTIAIEPYRFEGAIGLAPGWATRRPTVTERRWVSACVMARTNLHGVRVELSLRGAHPALAGSVRETLDYLLVEGAFYGDLFAPTGPELYACAAEVKDADLALSTQDLRACATSSDGKTTGCGFTYTGKCSLLDLSLAPACNSVAFPYQRCRAGRGRHAEVYHEVITVSLATALWQP